MLSWFTILRSSPQQAGIDPGEVFLTFDDGPNHEENVTPELLDVLHQHRVKAGFCVVGRLVRRHPETVRRMYRSGHLLINHTHNHVHPVRQSYRRMVEEVRACDHEIGRVLGVASYRSDYFRVPFGIVTPAVRKLVRRLQLNHVLLSHYGWDTQVGPSSFDSLIDGMIHHAIEHQGGLFVLHDGSLCRPKIFERDWHRSAENRRWVPEAVDRLVTQLKAAGLRFTIPADSTSAVSATAASRMTDIAA